MISEDRYMKIPNDERKSGYFKQETVTRLQQELIPCFWQEQQKAFKRGVFKTIGSYLVVNAALLGLTWETRSDQTLFANNNFSHIAISVALFLCSIWIIFLISFTVTRILSEYPSRKKIVVFLARIYGMHESQDCRFEA